MATTVDCAGARSGARIAGLPHSGFKNALAAELTGVHPLLTLICWGAGDLSAYTTTVTVTMVIDRAIEPIVTQAIARAGLVEATTVGSGRAHADTFVTAHCLFLNALEVCGFFTGASRTTPVPDRTDVEIIAAAPHWAIRVGTVDGAVTVIVYAVAA